MTHELALDKVTMTYSWHKISDQYKKNTIKYSPDDGISWETVTFVDGMYSYSDLNDYIHQYMNKKGCKIMDRTGDKYNINLSFISSTYRILVQIDNNYQLDLRNSKFGELIGYSGKIVDKTETGDDLPNITDSIDMIYINTDAITNSI